MKLKFLNLLLICNSLFASNNVMEGYFDKSDPMYLNYICDSIYKEFSEKINLEESDGDEIIESYEYEDLDSEDYFFNLNTINAPKQTLSDELLEKYFNIVYDLKFDKKFNTYLFKHLCEKVITDTSVNTDIFEYFVLGYKRAGYDSYQKLTSSFKINIDLKCEYINGEEKLRNILCELIHDWPNQLGKDNFINFD